MLGAFWFSSLWNRLRDTRGIVLVALALIAGGTWAFVALADEVMEGDTQSLDERILLALRNPSDHSDPIGSPAIEDAARDITALGGGPVLLLIIGIAGGYLLLESKPRTVLMIVASIGSGTLISFLLKGIFNRPRPELVPHGSYVYTSSFPSGHSFLSALTYLTLAIWLSRATKRWRAKVYLLTVAVLLTIMVGLSRVYLGVHWPTDVLAGWTIGAVWAILCDRVADWLQRRHQIEPEGEAA
ncbi:MAG: undecaprenyl-diphosphatase [Verrucomicrobia bacterium]|nr:MAG: undecaprenyl-diphosphatase [Verrucomicrobiota bacterium]